MPKQHTFSTKDHHTLKGGILSNMGVFFKGRWWFYLPTLQNCFIFSSPVSGSQQETMSSKASWKFKPLWSGWRVDIFYWKAVKLSVSRAQKVLCAKSFVHIDLSQHLIYLFCLILAYYLPPPDFKVDIDPILVCGLC